jgi:hypothetical protein
MGATQIYDERDCACSEVRGLLLSEVVVPIKFKLYFIKIISIYYSFCSQTLDRYIRDDKMFIYYLLLPMHCIIYIYYGVDIFDR